MNKKINILENFKLKSTGHKILSIAMMLMSLLFFFGFIIKTVPSGNIITTAGHLVIVGAVVYFTVIDLIEKPLSSNSSI